MIKILFILSRVFHVNKSIINNYWLTCILIPYCHLKSFSSSLTDWDLRRLRSRIYRLIHQLVLVLLLVLYIFLLSKPPIRLVRLGYRTSEKDQGYLCKSTGAWKSTGPCTIRCAWQRYTMRCPGSVGCCLFCLRKDNQHFNSTSTQRYSCGWCSCFLLYRIHCIFCHASYYVLSIRISIVLLRW